MSQYEQKYGARGLKVEQVEMTRAKGLVFNVLADGKDAVVVDATRGPPTPEQFSVVDAAIEGAL